MRYKGKKSLVKEPNITRVWYKKRKGLVKPDADGEEVEYSR